MSKIIRVTGCHDCPYCSELVFDDGIKLYYRSCKKSDMINPTGCFQNKTLPDNCPLEDEVVNNLQDSDIDKEMISTFHNTLPVSLGSDKALGLLAESRYK